MTDLEEITVKADRLRVEYGKLARTNSRAENAFTPLFWYLADGIEHQQPRTVLKSLVSIAREVEPGTIPAGNGLKDLYEPVRNFYLSNAKETDRGTALKRLNANPFYRVAKKLEYRTDEPGAIDLNSETIAKAYQRFLSANLWLKKNAGKVATARREFIEANQTRIDLERKERKQREQEAKQTAAPLPTAKPPFIRKVEQVERKQFEGEQTTLLNGQYRGRVW